MKLLNTNEKRFTLFPIQHADLWSFYKKLEDTDWRAEELDFSKDLNDWNKLKESEQFYIKQTLSFFAASDGIVNENLAINMIKNVQLAEAEIFYGMQIRNENVHSETYSRIIDVYIKDPEERNKMFNALEYMPVIRKKADWAFRYIENGGEEKTSIYKRFVRQLISFAAIEGIMFSGSFASIFWLKDRGLMQELGKANRFISRDESLHRDFAVNLYNNYVEKEYKLSKEEVFEIIHEAYLLECEFVKEAIPVSLISMDTDHMIQYLGYVMDNLLEDLGLDRHTKNKNPFLFMESIALENKNNFFETRGDEYNKAAISSTNINIQEDF